MPYTYPLTFPPANKVFGQAGIVADLDAAYNALAALAGINVTDSQWSGGADPTGTNDSTSAIAAALSAVPSPGGIVYLPAGTYLLNSSALAVASAGTRVIGAGAGATKLTIGASFTGAEVLNITADSCAVADLSIAGASSTTTSNPACTGIELSGVQHCLVRDVFAQYVNGWAIESAGSAGRGNLDCMFRGVISRNCAGGLHLIGNTGSGFLGEQFVSDLQVQQCGVTSGPNAGLDGLRIEDITDVLVQGVNIGMATSPAALGGAIHVKGACATVKVSNPDVGANALATAAPAILVEAGTNGTPGDISFSNGTAQGGLYAMQVTAGTDILLQGMRGHLSYSTGLSVTGGEVEVMGGSLTGSNQSGGTGYDVDCSAMTAGALRVTGLRCETGVGSGAGLVTNPVATSSKGYFYNNFFIGSGTTPSGVFSGTPQIVRGCVGYNPRGSITPPGITFGTAISASQNDVLIIFTAINGMTGLSIGSTSIPVPAVGVPFRVPARQTITIAGSGTTPTMTWIAD